MQKSALYAKLMIVLMAGSFLLSGCSLMKQHTPGAPTGGSSPTTTSATPGNAVADQKAIKSLMDAGNAKAKAGQWADAVTSFQQVLAMDPRHAQAHVQIGWAYAELQQWDDAKTHLMSAVALSPDNAGAHANLAWVYAEKQRWNDAQDEAKKAIDLDPKNAYAHATLAWAYQATGQDGLSVSEYEKSVELKPDLDNSRLALGVAYCNQGIGDRAKEQLSQLQKLNSPKVAELQTRLAKGCTAKK
jgi:tetratricopeptide (TPR) repeat protein